MKCSYRGCKSAASFKLVPLVGTEDYRRRAVCFCCEKHAPDWAKDPSAVSLAERITGTKLMESVRV